MSRHIGAGIGDLLHAFDNQPEFQISTLRVADVNLGADFRVTVITRVWIRSIVDISTNSLIYYSIVDSFCLAKNI